MTEGAFKTQSWLDEKGNYYPWMLELWDWQKRRDVSSRSLSSIPDAKLSNLVRCLDAACATPEVWERAEWLGKQFPLDPVSIPVDDPRRAEAQRQMDIIGFISQFTSWFRAKHGIDENPEPYGEISHILAAISIGEIDRSDLRGLKRRFGKYFTEDDLNIGDAGWGA